MIIKGTTHFPSKLSKSYKLLLSFKLKLIKSQYTWRVVYVCFISEPRRCSGKFSGTFFRTITEFHMTWRMQPTIQEFIFLKILIDKTNGLLWKYTADLRLKSEIITGTFGF